MKKVMIACMVLLVSCTNGNKARQVLEADGYTDVEITGYRPFKCSEDDNFNTGFKAKKNGKVITGTVCGGFLKGNTIRVD